MPILNFQLNSPGQGGVSPRIIYILSNDTIAQVSALGYLDWMPSQGLSLSIGDIALVTTKETPQSQYDVGWYEVSRVGAHWILIPTGSSGGGTIVDWVSITGTSQTAQAGIGYVPQNVALTTITLPSSPTFGNVVAVEGSGSGGWRLQAAAGQVIHIGSLTTSTAGSLSSVNRYDSTEVIYVETNSWKVRNVYSQGLTVA